MTLILSNAEAEPLLTMRGSIAALEALYRDLGRGSALNRPRTDRFTPTEADTGSAMPSAHQFKALVGAIPRLGVAFAESIQP